MLEREREGENERTQNTEPPPPPVSPEKPPETAIGSHQDKTGQRQGQGSGSQQQTTPGNQKSYLHSLIPSIQTLPTITNICSTQSICSLNPPPTFNPLSDLFLSLPEEEASPLCSKWSNTLIIKVVGKLFSMDYLKSSLQRIWKCSKPIQLIALGKGFYNASIISETESNAILSEGPWFINQFMVLVQQWVAEFRPSEAVISKIPVWISLPELPIEFHSIAVLE